MATSDSPNAVLLYPAYSANRYNGNGKESLLLPDQELQEGALKLLFANKITKTMDFEHLFVNESSHNLHNLFKCFCVPLDSHQMALKSFLSPCFAVSAVSASDQVFSRSTIFHTSKPVITRSKPPLHLG